MMARAFLMAGVVWLCVRPAVADDPKLKVLYLSGGGYHAYSQIDPILVEGVAKQASVRIDVKSDADVANGKNTKTKLTDDAQRKVLSDPKLGEGYDAIIYNICYADDEDQEMINNLIRVTKEGKPTVLLHCSMHCFMKSDAWTECCGERTRRHDKFRPFGTKKAEPVHPIVKMFPDEWKTDGDELYNEIEFGKDSTPLLKAFSVDSKKEHTVSWVHDFGKGKVFSLTLGHDLKTVEQENYHKLVANGLLWACGKLNEDGTPLAGYGPTVAVTNGTFNLNPGPLPPGTAAPARLVVPATPLPVPAN
jgi:type 1 glutamine amidotransferase